MVWSWRSTVGTGLGLMRTRTLSPCSSSCRCLPSKHTHAEHLQRAGKEQLTLGAPHHQPSMPVRGFKTARSCFTKPGCDESSMFLPLPTSTAEMRVQCARTTSQPTPERCQRRTSSQAHSSTLTTAGDWNER